MAATPLVRASPIRIISVHLPDKPSWGSGLRANDLKSSKQPVPGSNPAGGVTKSQAVSGV
jgi:hypothetical protein